MEGATGVEERDVVRCGGDESDTSYFRSVASSCDLLANAYLREGRVRESLQSWSSARRGRHRPCMPSAGSARQGRDGALQSVRVLLGGAMQRVVLAQVSLPRARGRDLRTLMGTNDPPRIGVTRATDPAE